MYDTNIDEELNGDFGTAENDDGSGNDNKENTPRQKGRTIKNNNINKPFSPTVKETFLKATHNKDTNEEDKDETMDTNYN